MEPVGDPAAQPRRAARTSSTGCTPSAPLAGVFIPAPMVTAFLTGWPSIIAVILNYVKRPEVRGTWPESHFSLADPHFLVRAAVDRVAFVLFITIIGIPFASSV